MLLISLPALPANDFLEDTFYNSFDETSPLVDFYTIEAISDIDGYEIEYRLEGLSYIFTVSSFGLFWIFLENNCSLLGKII